MKLQNEMIDIDNLTNQVLKNCDISDSKYAGVYSVCGLALRLRDLFKWEHRLDPWIEKDSAEVLEWIGEKPYKIILPIHYSNTGVSENHPISFGML